MTAGQVQAGRPGGEEAETAKAAVAKKKAEEGGHSSVLNAGAQEGMWVRPKKAGCDKGDSCLELDGKDDDDDGEEEEGRGGPGGGGAPPIFRKPSGGGPRTHEPGHGPMLGDEYLAEAR